MEETIQGNAPWCMAFITILFATGIGMPLNHYLFHGAFRVLHPVGWTAIGLKLAAIFWMMAIMGRIFFGLNPGCALFAGLPREAPDAGRKGLFETRTKKALSKPA